MFRLYFVSFFVNIKFKFFFYLKYFKFSLLNLLIRLHYQRFKFHNRLKCGQKPKQKPKQTNLIVSVGASQVPPDENKRDITPQKNRKKTNPWWVAALCWLEIFPPPGWLKPYQNRCREAAQLRECDRFRRHSEQIYSRLVINNR